MPLRPRLVDSATLKPKIIIPTPLELIAKQIVEPKLELPNFGEANNSKANSVSILINLFFVISLTFMILWLYHLYIDRKNTIITEIKDIIPSYENPILQQPNQIPFALFA